MKMAVKDYSGPVCRPWWTDDGGLSDTGWELCEHDSCWDVMTFGGSAWFRVTYGAVS
jgi:hypothetical protein